MKKSIKKPFRETIQRLEGADMTRVAGGLSDVVALTAPRVALARPAMVPMRASARGRRFNKSRGPSCREIGRGSVPDSPSS